MLAALLLVAVTGWQLPPAAQPAVFPPPAATSIHPVPLSPDAPPLSPFDSLLLALFRRQLQQQTGMRDPRPGFEGMLGELREFQLTHTVAEQADASEAIMAALGGPIPQIFRVVASPRSWAPAALSVCTVPLLRFLVGDMKLTQRAPDDPRAGGVLVQRCKVLEQGGCKGLCVNMCKLPTERYFSRRWGTPVTLNPNFETLQCQLSFGVAPPPEEELTNLLPAGCLEGCALATALSPRRGR